MPITEAEWIKGKKNESFILEHEGKILDILKTKHKGEYLGYTEMELWKEIYLSEGRSSGLEDSDLFKRIEKKEGGKSKVKTPLKKSLKSLLKKGMIQSKVIEDSYGEKIKHYRILSVDSEPNSPKPGKG